MSRVIPFEKRRFRTAAPHYLDGRVPYAPRLIELVADISRLRPDQRVMDLGCGPGQLAHAFAPYAGGVVGLDPEPEMLNIARGGAPAHVEFVEASSYELGLHFGMFQLVTIGRAFHWMDRVETLARLDEIIAPDGAIAFFGDSHPDLPENDWTKVFGEITDRYADGDRFIRRGAGFPPTIAILLGSAFTRLETVSVIERREMSVDSLVTRAFSRSTTSRQRLGERADVFENEIRTAMTTLFPDGGFSEVVATQALIARRPAHI
jgi:SAM-dependent methyltransferase